LCTCTAMFATDYMNSQKNIFYKYKFSSSWIFCANNCLSSYGNSEFGLLAANWGDYRFSFPEITHLWNVWQRRFRWLLQDSCWFVAADAHMESEQKQRQGGRERERERERQLVQCKQNGTWHTYTETDIQNSHTAGECYTPLSLSSPCSLVLHYNKVI
jgi:hypothetical protein